jgi:hypothetical protein
MGSHAFAGKDLNVEAIVKNISCFGKQDGGIELLITGGKGPYAIEWKDGVNQSIRNNLAKGSYSFRVVDAKGSSVESEVSVTAPSPLTVYFSQTSNCMTSELGEINISVEGGTPLNSGWDQQYEVTINETLDAKKELYINKLQIEDGNGCMLSFPVMVTYIDQNDSFSKGSKPSANPMAEIQIKLGTNNILLLGGL